MAFAPSTAVRLLNVPFERDYKNVLYYSSRAHQTETLMAMTVPGKVFKDFSYQRKDNCIKIPAHIDSLWNCNYCMYQNANYTDKWFYAFITHMEYVNDGLTKVYIETDVYNTWCFDINIKASFVEREHSKDDVIGENTVEENLELGEFITNYTYVDPQLDGNGDDYYIVIAVTEEITGYDDSNGGYVPTPDDGEFKDVGGAMYGGVFSGVRYLVFKQHEYSKVINTLESYSYGHAEAVQAIFIAPKMTIPELPEKGAALADSTAANAYQTKLAFPVTLDTYSPRNNKLLTHPYHFLCVSNAQGGSAVYHWERFANFQQGVTFGVYGVVTPGCSIRTVPVAYMTASHLDASLTGYMTEDYGLALGKFPICNWQSDIYTNWLTQNSVNMKVENVSAAFGVIGGAITGATAGAALGLPGVIGGALLGAIGGGISTSDVYEGKGKDRKLVGHELSGVGFNGSNLTTIGSIIGRRSAMSYTPPQLNGNLNCGDVMFASKRNNFYYHFKSIRKEYAELIDSYFDMFGYATHKVKVPEKCHRSRYWFTKTAGLNCDGAVPQDDLAVFKGIYDKGVTFWRNPSEIENYSLSNTALGKYIY